MKQREGKAKKQVHKPSIIVTEKMAQNILRKQRLQDHAEELLQAAKKIQKVITKIELK